MYLRLRGILRGDVLPLSVYRPWRNEQLYVCVFLKINSARYGVIVIHIHLSNADIENEKSFRLVCNSETNYNNNCSINYSSDQGRNKKVRTELANVSVDK